jgi:hypothetical protein
MWKDVSDEDLEAVIRSVFEDSMRSIARTALVLRQVVLFMEYVRWGFQWLNNNVKFISFRKIFCAWLKKVFFLSDQYFLNDFTSKFT